MEQRETAVSALEEMLEGLGFSGEAEEEPVALHRRGHWFEPSIAHHFLVETGKFQAPLFLSIYHLVLYPS